MTNNSPAPILITGCARSGISLVAGAVHLCGAYGGSSIDSAPRMYENVHIRENIVTPYLTTIGADKKGQYPLPDTLSLFIPSSWATKVKEVIAKDEYLGGPWFYKSPTSCLIWPVWHYAFPKAKWIIVRRRTGDIISSCMKTSFMDAFRRPEIRNVLGVELGIATEQEGLLWWVHQHEERFVEMITEGLNCKVIWPHRMVDGDYQEMMETIDWLGLKWNSQVLSFIDPKFWRARRR